MRMFETLILYHFRRHFFRCNFKKVINKDEPTVKNCLWDSYRSGSQNVYSTLLIVSVPAFALIKPYVHEQPRVKTWNIQYKTLKKSQQLTTSKQSLNDIQSWMISYSLYLDSQMKHIVHYTVQHCIEFSPSPEFLSKNTLNFKISVISVGFY
jgi:hypothetical protein